jgi:small basic protein (TIGR04137 family)
MSVDKSLVSRMTMSRARNVYTRAERLEILKKDGRLGDGQVLGLPKTRVEKIVKRVKAPKEKKAEEGAAAPGAAAPAAGATPAAGAKGAAAPAAGGKAAAPAAAKPAADKKPAKK